MAVHIQQQAHMACVRIIVTKPQTIMCGIASPQKHRNQNHCTRKPPRKSTIVRSVLHTKLQTCPQLPRGMQRIRGPFILIIILTYLETLYFDTRPLDHIIRFIHICTLLFISCILLPTFFRFSNVFTLHLYISLTRNIFSYP